MSQESLRTRWRREVFRTKLVPDSVRVVLLALAEHMRENGYVSVARRTIAAEIGRDPRRINERIQAAVDARLLDRVRRGRPGVTAVYRAVLPWGGRVPQE